VVTRPLSEIPFAWELAALSATIAWRWPGKHFLQSRPRIKSHEAAEPAAAADALAGAAEPQAVRRQPSMMSADAARRLSVRLLVGAGAMTGAAILLVLLQPKQTVEITLAHLGVTLFYLAWPILLISVVAGFVAWFRGSRTWWSLVGLVFLAGLTWLVGCGIPAANLS